MPIDHGMRELCANSVLSIAFAIMFLVSGCGSVPPPVAAPARAVHFVLVNLSDCAWQITLTPADGGAVLPLRLQARESRELEISGGAYGIEQTALNGGGGTDSTRRFTVRLESGQTYRWRLVTLLSAPIGETQASTVHE